MNTNEYFGRIREKIEEYITSINDGIINNNSLDIGLLLSDAQGLMSQLISMAQADTHTKVISRLQGELEPLSRIGNILSEAKERNHDYNVYVIELDSDVSKHWRFTNRNCDYRPGCTCVYVGMSWHSPEARFEKHKKGIHSNNYVRNYGLRLRPEYYTKYNPMLRKDAEFMEKWLAAALSKKGFAVWQG